MATGRINVVAHGGFSAFSVIGDTNAIVSPPGTGGILLERPGEARCNVPVHVFGIHFVPPRTSRSRSV
jgi:hypothetical protein